MSIAINPALLHQDGDGAPEDSFLVLDVGSWRYVFNAGQIYTLRSKGISESVTEAYLMGKQTADSVLLKPLRNRRCIVNLARKIIEQERRQSLLGRSYTITSIAFDDSAATKVWRAINPPEIPKNFLNLEHV